MLKSQDIPVIPVQLECRVEQCFVMCTSEDGACWLLGEVGGTVSYGRM